MVRSLVYIYIYVKRLSRVFFFISIEFFYALYLSRTIRFQFFHLIFTSQQIRYTMRINDEISRYGTPITYLYISTEIITVQLYYLCVGIVLSFIKTKSFLETIIILNYIYKIIVLLYTCMLAFNLPTKNRILIINYQYYTDFCPTIYTNKMLS